MRRRSIAIALAGLGSLTIIGFSPVGMAPPLRECANGVCTMQMTAPQLLHMAERLVVQRKFDEARPLLAALAHAPELSMQRHFLQGYVAAETGELDAAADEFRSILRDRPEVTRARLELARVLMMSGKDMAADHHYRLAEQAEDLPPEIERTIRLQRGILRDRRNWRFNLDFGLVPDSNINNATDARTIDINFGGGSIPLELNPDARRKSGVGQMVNVSSGVRLRLSDGLAMAIDGDGQVINQKGQSADDVSLLLAAGPEVTLSGGARATVQAIGVRRWYGGKVASRGVGVRASFQKNLSAGQRIGVQADVRKTQSGYGDQYDGWSYAGYATYERVVARSMVASASLFARRDDLNSRAYSSTEYGGSIGIGGELPFGINAGLTGGISRAEFDDRILAFGTNPRDDWRFNARAYLGTRAIRVLGFSPSVTYTYNKIDSNYDFYKTDRHRVQFGLARYF